MMNLKLANSGAGIWEPVPRGDRGQADKSGARAGPSPCTRQDSRKINDRSHVLRKSELPSKYKPRITSYFCASLSHKYIPQGPITSITLRCVIRQRSRGQHMLLEQAGQRCISGGQLGSRGWNIFTHGREEGWRDHGRDWAPKRRARRSERFTSSATMETSSKQRRVKFAVKIRRVRPNRRRWGRRREPHALHSSPVRIRRRNRSQPRTNRDATTSHNIAQGVSETSRKLRGDAALRGLGPAE